MKNKIFMLFICSSLVFSCNPSVYAQTNSSENVSIESETEIKSPVKSGTYEIELECDEEYENKDENTIKLHFSSTVENDVTGNWRISTLSTSKKVTDYALKYYDTFFSSDDEIHGIVNFADSTTIRIKSVFSNVINVSVLSYVDGEEHDAKILFGGDLLEDYWIYVDTGEIEDIMSEE